MILSEIIKSLEEFCPTEFAEKWDNPGLQVGCRDKEVQTVFLAVDATSAVIEDAVRNGADLILTHHPLMFSGTKRVTDSDYLGKRVISLVKNDIACYAMHTNFDVMGMADAAADALNLQDREVLEITYKDSISSEGLGRIGELPEHMSLHDLAVMVKEVFDIPHVRFYGDPDEAIVRTAILPGAGSSEIDTALKADADVMITGDITHHTGIDSVEKGIAVIDAGHYGIEKLFVPYMKDYLQREMPELKVVCAKVHEPFYEV